MARYLRSTLFTNETVTAGAVPMQRDLPVNPLSFLLVTLRFQTLAALTLPSLANVLGVFTNVEVLQKGATVFGASLADAFRIVGHVWRRWPRLFRLNDDVNATSFLTVPIPFSRVPYWTEEAFPAVRKGDLSLKLTIAAAFTAITGVQLQVETLEILDADPRRFMKVTTGAKTPADTNEHTVDLPIGNDILGILLFGTTVPAGTSFNASIRTVKLLLDNVEFQTALGNFESLHGENLVRHGAMYDPTSLRILENLAAAYTQNVESGAPADLDGDAANYLYLDYDPLTDGQYAIKTAGRASVQLKIKPDVADAIRTLPVELVTLPGAGGPAA